MGKYFGTDGIRGRASVQFPPHFVFKLGLAVAQLLKEKINQRKPLVLIGKDTRISGDFIEAALSSSLAAGGCDVVLLGVLPTPGVAVLTRVLQADAAVVISASHNPYYDNGIKFFDNLGYKLSDQMEERIEQLLDSETELEYADEEKLGRISRYENAVQTYIDQIKAKLSPNLTGLKIVVDNAHGAASVVAEPLLTSLGAEVISIGNEPDGCNINCGCGSTALDKLRAKVTAEKADLGLAFDGDADRLLAVDEHGEEVDGDQIVAIIATDMHEKGDLSVNEVVITQMSNMGLRLAMEALGVNVVETKVGDRYVLERMLSSGANIGGEQSGHVILSDYNSTGDGPAAALRLLQVMCGKKQPLSQLAQAMRKMPQYHLSPQVKDKKGWADDAEIQAKIAAAEQKLNGQGRILIRPSGTEPKVRVMAEGEDVTVIRSIVEELAQLISQKMNS